MKTKHKSYIVIVVLVVIAIIVFSNATFIVLKPVERGVVFKKFTTGLEKDKIYKPGFHVIAPWNEMYIYNIKKQQREESLDILDRNGLSLTLDVTVRFNPIPERIGYLYEDYQMNYVDEVVIPELRASVRRVAGRFNAEEIYSTKRKEVESTIINETAKILEKNNITMSALLIRSIKLPEKIKQAIEKKLEQEQESLAYEYRLEKEKLEAERKKIAAEGEAEANRTITNSLSKNLLKMRGIEATIKLSESENTKVVVIGSGEDGLPLILGSD